MSERTRDEQEMLRNWELAFTLPSVGCRRTCVCGKEFYNPNGGWDWEDGELEELDADDNAFIVDYSVGEISFDGKEYANPCDCWHDRALKIIAFLKSHREGIGQWFAAEKERAKAEADKYPELEIYGEQKVELPEGWDALFTAPKGQEVEVISKRGTIHRAHWAQDLTGEEQPPFSGWFEKSGPSSYREIKPIGWRPCGTVEGED